jgi:fermentation-respiration switch protein FrsA (DUF1100 family)
VTGSPLAQSRRLYEAVRAPKDLLIIAGADHNDIELGAGSETLAAVDRFLSAVRPPPGSGLESGRPQG